MVFTPRQTNRVMKHRYIAQKQTHTYVANESSVNVRGKLHGGDYSMFNKYSWNTQLKYVANKQKTHFGFRSCTRYRHFYNQFKDPNVEIKVITLLEEIQEKAFVTTHSQGLLRFDTKDMKYKKKHNLEVIKCKSFCLLNDIVKNMKRKPIGWGKNSLFKANI